MATMVVKSTIFFLIVLVALIVVVTLTSASSQPWREYLRSEAVGAATSTVETSGTSFDSIRDHNNSFERKSGIKSSDVRILLHGLLATNEMMPITGSGSDSSAESSSSDGNENTLSREDSMIIGESFISAYSEVYSSPHNSKVVKFRIESVGSIPDDEAKRLVQQLGPSSSFFFPRDTEECLSGSVTSCLTGSDTLILIANVDNGCEFCSPIPAGENAAAAVSRTVEHDQRHQPQPQQQQQKEQKQQEIESSVMEALAGSFCQKLRLSGSDHLATAKGCAVSLLAPPSIFTIFPFATEDQPQQNPQQQEAQIIMHGSENFQDLSSYDVLILERTFKTVFHKAFKKQQSGCSKTTVDSIKAITGIELFSVDDDGCSKQYDDEAFDQNSDACASDSRLIVTKVRLSETPPCETKNENTTVTSNWVEEQEDFDNRLLFGLKNSRSKNLANLHNCSFRFVV